MIFRPAYFIASLCGCFGKIVPRNGSYCIVGMTSKEQCHEAIRILTELGLISDDEKFELMEQIDESPLPEQHPRTDRQFSMALCHFAQGIGDLLAQLKVATAQSPADFHHHDPNPGSYLVAELIDEDAPPG
jgi:hypothetical protein